MGLIRRYKRWRHGRGFGVHSPFAYHFVTEVLRLPRIYGYYAYRDVASLYRECRPSLSPAEAILIFRVLNELRPATIAVSARAEDRGFFAGIAKKAVPTCTIVDENAEFLLSAGGGSCGFHTAASGYFTDCHTEAFGRMSAALRSGHIYVSGSRAVIVAREGLPRQVFDVRF